MEMGNGLYNIVCTYLSNEKIELCLLENKRKIVVLSAFSICATDNIVIVAGSNRMLNHTITAKREVFE